MDVELDPGSPVPMYQQIRDQVVEGMARGSLRPDDPLVSVRTLSVAFGINPATVVRAYDLLRDEGYIHTSRRSGSVVVRGPSATQRPERLAPWRARLTTVLAEARADGMSNEQILHECVTVTTGFVL